MLTIVDILDPMLCTIVAAEGLGILERLSLPVNKAPRWMIVNLLEHTMHQHYLRDVVCISGAVHEESYPSQFVHKRFRSPQRLCHHVRIAVVPGDMLRPVAPLLNQKLAMDSMLVESRDPLCNTEAVITCHYLPRVMEGLRHIHEELNGVGLPLCLPLCREGPRSIQLLWSILSLDDLDSPHDWPAAISVGNPMILIAKRMGLAGERHEPRTELEPRVH